MNKPRTPRQSEAIESVDRSVCVRAGAGTGKTFVLVGRYMELLRRRKVESVREIAALTYTEKASKEMKDRLRRECLDEERSATGADAAWWRRQRIDLETAHVGTLHGFCASLLYEHPVEAGVDPKFIMLDAVEQSVLARRAIDDVLRRELDADSPGVLQFALEAGRGGVHDMLAVMISRRVDADAAAAALDALGEGASLEGIGRLLATAQAEFLDSALAEADSKGILCVLRENRSEDASDKAEARRREMLRLVGEIGITKDPVRCVALAAELRNSISLAGGSTKKWGAEALAAVKEAFAALRDILNEVPGGEFGRKPGDMDAKALEYSRTLVRLYREACAAYAKAKSERGCLDFEDLLIGARALLANSDAVRRRVQEKIRFLLVDELQDSALIDREIMLLVASDVEASRKAGKPVIPPGRLFVVGDDKQSIYRFRGAEVAVFHELAEALGEQGKLVDLDRNFRTVGEGVAFANDFFGKVLGRTGAKRPYESRYVDLDAHRKEKASFLEVLIPEPLPDDGADDGRQREAQMVAARIKEMVEKREPLVWDEPQKAFRGVEFRDVAVLFRAMTAVDLYERALRDAGVQYYIVGGRGFYRAQEVLDVLTALKALERPRDAVALMGTLRSPLFGISDETLFFMSRRDSVARGLAEAESVENITEDQRLGLVAARSALGELAAVKNRLPISRLIGELLRRTGYDAALLAQFRGNQRLANVEKLIDLARAFEAKGLFTLDEFIRYIEEFVTVEEREREAAAEEESSNVVRLMSVHAAKGLEFPVVFVCDLAHRRPGGGRALELDGKLGVALNLGDEDGAKPILYDLVRCEAKLRDEAEDLRVLYVALTRARDHLVLSGALPGGSTQKGTWLDRLAGAYDLLDEHGLPNAGIEFGKEGFKAPVRTKPPEAPEARAKERHRAAWKALDRIDRLVERASAASRLPEYDRSAYVEPVPLDLAAKQRFVASEFAEYLYCPQRYYLSRILGILPGDVALSADGGASSGLAFGTLVHRALAAWDFRGETLAKTIEHALAGVGLAGSEKGKRMQKDAAGMIRSALEAGLFAAAAASTERLGECPVAARVNDFVVEGSLDGAWRLADGGLEIVDYKTDRLNPAQESPAMAQKGGPAAQNAALLAQKDELSAHYELQIACYALAATRAGMKVSRASLLFLRPALRHDWICDAAQLASWEKRLTEIVASIRAGRFNERRDGSCRCAHAWTCGRATVSGVDLDLA